MVHRIAVLDRELCNSKKCGQECVRFCPVNRMGSECIVLNVEGKALISEELCTGCGICTKKCPFEAIAIVNLAEELKQERIHQYGVNSFRLYRLPPPRKGKVVGLVGRNGVGKTTALNILSGNLKPNLGFYDEPPDWDQILESFKGTELKDHFQRIANQSLRISLKPQGVYLIPRMWKGEARDLLSQVDSLGTGSQLVERLNLETCIDKPVGDLSGGELQRLAVAAAASKDADLYFFDEPSSYNDVYQRLEVAHVIQEIAASGKSVILVEHDLTLLDYLSDFIHILYGEPGVYGIASGVQTARTGVNVLLDGYIPGENIRFRSTPVVFEVFSPVNSESAIKEVISYGKLDKNYPGFQLHISEGSLKASEIIGILGGNALGKTTFMKLVAGVEKPDDGSVNTSAKISYKPQYLSSDYDGTVEELLSQTCQEFESGLVHQEIILPLGLKKIMETRVRDLSGGELQRVAIATCLLKDADVYALDEPSAFVDVEDRIVLAKAIQRFVKSRGKAALVVDHDIQLVDIVSDSLMIFSGEAGIRGKASPAMRKEKGMNLFLKGLGITYRRDVDTGRPRVNKPNSKLDRAQKEAGEYYYVKRASE